MSVEALLFIRTIESQKIENTPPTTILDCTFATSLRINKYRHHCYQCVLLLGLFCLINFYNPVIRVIIIIGIIVSSTPPTRMVVTAAAGVGAGAGNGNGGSSASVVASSSVSGGGGGGVVVVNGGSAAAAAAVVAGANVSNGGSGSSPAAGAGVGVGAGGGGGHGGPGVAVGGGGGTGTASGNSATTTVNDCPYERYNAESVIVLGFFGLFVISFGLLANLLNVRIFTHKLMRVSLLNWYLAALAVSDTLMQVTSFLMFCLPRIGEYFDNFDAINFGYWITPAAYAIGMMAQTTSVWLTVAMSLHRFVGVCLPFKASLLCSRRNTLAILVGVPLFGIVFNFSRFWEVVLTSRCYSTDVNATIVQVSSSQLRGDPIYKTILLGWCYTLAMFILPFLLLIFLNSNVLRAIRRTRRLHDQIRLDVLQGAKSRELAKEIRTSIMLVAVVVVFLLCNALALILNIFEVTEVYVYFRSTFTRLVYVSNVLVLVNSCINIFIYSSFSERYRLLLRHYLSCSWMRTGGELLIDRTATNNF
ncbi:FMRFamide receptor [Trichinella sp. T9]|uniref:FMRFamide receptor n=1 Tax=Trichinella murrelli TaxID=144512 RepID=A0A0V0TP06_9BILA|nr:FMRFamide receptor [Trichinella murrelli]KRX60998.1 FMRFamide receptor [Trichinella sp. T9]